MIKSKCWKYLISLLILLVMARWAYKYTPYRIEFLGHYDKVWAHRVNTTEKLSSALRFFRGVELDLVYLPFDQKLDVNHPPAPTISLDYETYLKSIPKGEHPFFWLDIKNLTKEHSEAIFNRLETLRNNSGLKKEHFLIESRYPEALIIFITKGYRCSYYLPQNVQDIQTEILTQHPKLGISANYIHYDYLSAHFPLRQKYLWKIDPLSISSYSKTREILKDTTVRVVLSKFKSFNGNR